MEKFEDHFDINDDLVKYLTGTADDIERSNARAWISASEQNKKHFDELRDIYEASMVSATDADFNADTSWEKVKGRFYKRKAEMLSQKIQVGEKSYGLGQWLRIAAVFVIAFILGGITLSYFGFSVNKGSKTIYNEVVAPFGSRSSLTLADGTQVWLNAGSRLKYPVNFADITRDVYLEGEGYFKVTRMEKKKFIVHTSHININVLGTEFNVKAYSNEKSIQTTLVKGKIVIEGSGKWTSQLKTTELKPNQTAVFYKSKDLDKKVEPAITIKKETDLNVSEHQSIAIAATPDPSVFTSWKDQKWIIVSEELQNLATKLERRYDVKITFANESLKNYKFTGTLADETLEQVLKIMKITAPIDFDITGKNVVFKTTNSKKSYDKLLINR